MAAPPCSRRRSYPSARGGLDSRRLGRPRVPDAALSCRGLRRGVRPRLVSEALGPARRRRRHPLRLRPRRDASSSSCRRASPSSRVGKAAVPMAAAAHRALGTRVDEALVIAPAGLAREGLPPGRRVLPRPPRTRTSGASRPGTRPSRSPRVSARRTSSSSSSRAAGPASWRSRGGISLSTTRRGRSRSSWRPGRRSRTSTSCAAPSRASRRDGSRPPRRAADVVTLVLSDLGDDGWHLVASGPTLGVPPRRRGRARDPRELPARPARAPRRCARFSMHRRPRRSGRRDGGPRWSVLLADIRTALEGARHEAHRLGADVRVVPELLAGEARAAGRRLAARGRERRAICAGAASPPAASSRSSAARRRSP